MEVIKMAAMFGLLVLFQVLMSEAARISCYHSSWAMYRPSEGTYDVKDFPADLCTHAIYGAIGVNTDTWGVEVEDEWLDVSNGGFQRFVDMKQSYPDLKTVVTLGGWYNYKYGTSLSQLVSDAARRKIFTASLVYFLRKWNFDGLDIDWEFPGDSILGNQTDKANFVSLLGELREAFDAQGRGWELTVAASVLTERMDEGLDVAGICSNVNAVHLMTFELRDYTDNFTDVHSPLYRRSFDEGVYIERNVNDGAMLWTTAGCPAEKIVIGIPLYGRSFSISGNTTDHELHSACEGPGGSGLITGESGLLAYYEICDGIQNRNWTENWDDVGMVPFAYSDATWVGYENPRSVGVKAEWILQQGYAGAMVRATDLDDFRGACGTRYPLLQVLHDSLVAPV